MTTMQQRRGTAAQWEAAQTALESTPILDAGEFGLETDTMMVKIGDGVSLWGDLAYINGQDNIVVYNGTGSTIPKGSVVYISGAQGQNPSISLADADTEATSSKTLGVTAKAITTGNTGPVAVFGVIVGIDTSAFTAGQALWLSSTAGGLTATKPTQPAHLVFVGYCIKSHANAGSIFINPQNGYELDELHDLLIDAKASIADNEVLAFDTSSQLWKNQTPSEAGIAALTGASFTGTVNVTTANNGSSVILKNTDGTGVRVLAGESVSGSLPGVIFSPYVTGTEKTASQFYYADNGDQWVFEPTLKLGNGYLTSGSATGYIFNTIATTLNIGGAATTVNLGAATGNTTIGNNLIVTGNLTVQGDQVVTNTSTVEVEDSMIYIGTGNSADSMDIGIVGHRTPSGGSYQHTGLVRDATDGTWKLFTGVTTEPSGSTLDFTGATYEPIKIGALDATSGSFSTTLGVTGATTLSSTLGVTGAVTLSSTLGVTSTATIGGMLTANGGITGAAAKNMTVASLMPSGGTASNGVGVVMTASVTGASAPTKRPNGDNLVAGDVWISW